jgi:hypothetical protein
VIHNWDDESAMAILSGCRRAMGSAARLLLVEGILKSASEQNDAFRPSFLGLHMLVTLGGRQRTAEEFAGLYAATRFRLTRIVTLPGQYHLIEGEPI